MQEDLVAELLGGPTYANLRHRAKEAKERACATREAAEQELIDDLSVRLWAFLRDQLGVDAGTLAAATVQTTIYGAQTSSTVSPVKVRNQQVSMTVDGVQIRARYTTTDNFSTDDDAIFEYKDRALTWHAVNGLAHLGQIMAVKG